MPQYPYIEVEDYLTLDDNSKSARYEYLDGELLMLAGGSTFHSMIIANLIIAIGKHLEDGPYCIYNSDIRLQLSESCFVHPDVSVSCDSRDHELGDKIRYPCMVVEVLSQSTEVTDRIKKFAHYRECPTIEEYLMIDSHKILIELYHREGKRWIFSTFGPGEDVRLKSLDIQFSVDEVYKGIKFANTSPDDNESE